MNNKELSLSKQGNAIVRALEGNTNLDRVFTAEGKVTYLKNRMSTLLGSNDSLVTSRNLVSNDEVFMASIQLNESGRKR